QASPGRRAKMSSAPGSHRQHGWRSSRPLPRWGHTYSKLALVESARAVELPFAVRVFHRKKEIAARAAALLRRTCLRRDTSVQTTGLKPMSSRRNWPVRGKAFWDFRLDRG